MQLEFMNDMSSISDRSQHLCPTSRRCLHDVSERRIGKLLWESLAAEFLLLEGKIALALHTASNKSKHVYC
eukprot:m.154221 g.154221  ORF g.154221 m.154221 type:complete len:71 (+) comp16251_c2_seq1:207-419(+)